MARGELFLRSASCRYVFKSFLYCMHPSFPVTHGESISRWPVERAVYLCRAGTLASYILLQDDEILRARERAERDGVRSSYSLRLSGARERKGEATRALLPCRGSGYVDLAICDVYTTQEVISRFFIFVPSV
jgi:hypothetical protein